MSHDLVVLIGHDRPEVAELKSRTPRRVIAFDSLPRVQLRDGELFVHDTWDGSGPVGNVVFHGIFEDDLPLLGALALWGGPCLPSAHGMLDCRPRIPNLARVRRVSRFAAMPRGYASPGTTYSPDGPTVAKWGEWHCGEGKERFTGDWEPKEPTLFEPFVEGDAVRVTAIGDRVWQVRLGGDDWKKSIHHDTAAFTEVDPELADDVRRMRDRFDLAVCAADYIVTPGGVRHLLELNHIPNVTQFAEIREAYLDLAAAWING